MAERHDQKINKNRWHAEGAMTGAGQELPIDLEFVSCPSPGTPAVSPSPRAIHP